MRGSRNRQARQRHLSRRVNVWILGGYIGVTILVVALKAWQTVESQYPVGWLAKTNGIIWDAITLAAALGALALGVREMVLAYFIRKEYEDEIAAIRAERDAALQQTQNDMLLQLIEQNRQLIEQNRQLIERLGPSKQRSQP